MSFDVEITCYVGETNLDGTLKDLQKLINNGVISPTAKIRMPVFDVDYDAAPTAGRQPGRDRVTINGVNCGFLTGANSVWKLNEFEVPVRFLKFARLHAPPVRKGTTNNCAARVPRPRKNCVKPK